MPEREGENRGAQQVDSQSVLGHPGGTGHCGRDSDGVGENFYVFAFCPFYSFVSNLAGQVPFSLNSPKMLSYSCHMSLACKKLHV